MTTLVITFIVVAFVLFFLELFAPGGILGLFGGISLVVAAILAYETLGIIGSVLILIGGAVVGLALFFLEVNVLAKLPIGKYARHEQRQTTQTVPVGRSELVGKTGVALTTLAPSGRVKIENETFEAAANSGLITKSATIEVVRSEHLKLIVKEI